MTVWICFFCLPFSSEYFFNAVVLNCAELYFQTFHLVFSFISCTFSVCLLMLLVVVLLLLLQYRLGTPHLGYSWQYVELVSHDVTTALFRGGVAVIVVVCCTFVAFPVQ